MIRKEFPNLKALVSYSWRQTRKKNYFNAISYYPDGKTFFYWKNGSTTSWKFKNCDEAELFVYLHPKTLGIQDKRIHPHEK